MGRSEGDFDFINKIPRTKELQDQAKANNLEYADSTALLEILIAQAAELFLRRVILVFLMEIISM